MILLAILALCLLLALLDLAAAVRGRARHWTLVKNALALAVAAAGTVACSRTVPPKPDPVPAQCDSLCYAECDTAIPRWAPPDPDAPEAWDALGPQVIKPAHLKLQQCELHRKACSQCIERLRDAGVLR